MSGDYAVRSGNMKLFLEVSATLILVSLDRGIGKGIDLPGSQKWTARKLAGLRNEWNRDKDGSTPFYGITP